MEPPDRKQRAATEEMVELVYQELRRVARRYFRNQQPGFTLHPTEIVNEACLHLIQHSRVPWESAEHFRAIATRKIWQVIVDHLKHRRARKRGGPKVATGGDTTVTGKAAWQRVPLDAIAVPWRDRTVDVLDLAEALEALGQESPRLHDVVMLHWFGGLTYPEVARYLALSASTIEKDFRYALAWLNRRLAGDDDGQ